MSVDSLVGGANRFERPNTARGKVVESPDPLILRVVIPAYSQSRFFDVPNDQWASAKGTPAIGDDCLVVFDGEGDVWAIISGSGVNIVDWPPDGDPGEFLAYIGPEVDDVAWQKPQAAGPAGGDLSGTYPNPQIKSGTIIDADVSAANKDGTPTTPSLRTLGTGAQQAAAGNDARLSDARVPTNHASKHQPGGPDAMVVDAGAATGSLRTLGTGAQQAVAGNDSRLTGARQPTPHKATHEPGGSDAMTVDAAPAVGSLRTLGTGAQQAAAGNDPRFGTGAPSGTAGGDLTGTYPDPQIAAGVITDAEVAAANKDGTPSTPSMRTLGTGANQAAAGNDPRIASLAAASAFWFGSWTGGQAIAGVAAGFVKVSFGAATASAGFTLVLGTLRCDVAGRYVVRANATTRDATGSYHVAQLNHKRAGVSQRATESLAAMTSFWAQVSVEAIFDMAVGDVIELWITTDANRTTDYRNQIVVSPVNVKGDPGALGPKGDVGPPGTQLIGSPVAWLLSAMPAGYREFDGSAIVQAIHPQLYALFGATIPDLRGRVMMGQSSTYPIATTGGAVDHKLTPAEMPVHTHSLAAAQPYQQSNGPVYQNAVGGGDQARPVFQDGSFNSITATGGDAVHNNLQPYRTVRWVTVAG